MSEDQAKAVVREYQVGDGTTRLSFFCPGCNYEHVLNRKWTFDGNFVRPTFTPSIMHRAPTSENSRTCHSYVTEGQIQFLNDCWHELRGKTVPLPPIES